MFLVQLPVVLGLVLSPVSHQCGDEVPVCLEPRVLGYQRPVVLAAFVIPGITVPCYSAFLVVLGLDLGFLVRDPQHILFPKAQLVLVVERVVGKVTRLESVDHGLVLVLPLPIIEHVSVDVVVDVLVNAPHELLKEFVGGQAVALSFPVSDVHENLATCVDGDDVAGLVVHC